MRAHQIEPELMLRSRSTPSPNAERRPETKESDTILMEIKPLKMASGSIHNSTGYPAIAPPMVRSAAYLPMGGQPLHHAFLEKPILSAPSSRSPVGQTWWQKNLGLTLTRIARAKPPATPAPNVRSATREQIALNGLSCRTNRPARNQGIAGHKRTLAAIKQASRKIIRGERFLCFIREMPPAAVRLSAVGQY
jgi:hypothetical protein